MVDHGASSSLLCVPIMSYPPSSAAQVFAIPELLETILLFLPAKDLLLSQRTARSFRRTIQASIRLKRILFLAPDWLLEGRAYNPYRTPNAPGERPANNNLLLRAFPGNWPSVTSVVTDPPTSSEQISEQQRERNPHQLPTGHWSWNINISFPSDGPPVPSTPAVDYPEASWRRMYLSQPPCTSLYLVRRYQRSRRPAMVREDGITMEAFYEQAMKATYGNGGSGTAAGGEKKWHRSYVSSDRDWHFEGHLQFSSMDDD